MAAFAFTGCTWGGDTGNLSISISIPKLQQPRSKAPFNSAIKSMTITAYIAGEEDNLKEVGPVTLKDGGTTNFEIDLGIVPAGPATVVIEAIGADATNDTYFPYYGSTKTVVRPGVNVVNVYMDYGCLVTYNALKAYKHIYNDPYWTLIFDEEDSSVRNQVIEKKQFVIPLGGKIPAFRVRMLDNQFGRQEQEFNGALCRFMGYAVHNGLPGGDFRSWWIEDFTAPQMMQEGTKGPEMELVGVWYNYNRWMKFSPNNNQNPPYYTVSKESLPASGAYTDKLFIPEKYNGKPVAMIAYNGFEKLGSLVEVHIPASVTTIGKNAFQGCEGLTAINFASDGKLETIGESAFAQCGKWTFDMGFTNSISRITIPASVTNIKGNAFYNCGVSEIAFAIPTGWKYSSTDPSGYTSMVESPHEGEQEYQLSQPARNARIFTGDRGVAGQQGDERPGCEWIREVTR